MSRPEFKSLKTGHGLTTKDENVMNMVYLMIWQKIEKCVRRVLGLLEKRRYKFRTVAL